MTDTKWGLQTFEASEDFTGLFGNLELSAKPVGKELWVRNNFVDTDSEEEWSRWALNAEAREMYLEPAFPDKSVVVMPETPFHLMPGVSAKIYVRIPIWVTLKLKKDDKEPIEEHPSAVLSLTWFGTPVAGELCYWISTSAKRQYVADPSKNFLVTCPIKLKNVSDEDLLVDKLCVRVNWLSIYEVDGCLWSNETRIKYRGSDEVSEISVDTKAPSEFGKATLVSKSKVVLKKSFSIKTFIPWGSR